MIIHIKGYSNQKSMHFSLKQFFKIELDADTSYEMRIYTEKDEHFDLVACEQVKQQSENYVYLIPHDAITILGFWQTPDKPSHEPQIPQNAEKLIARIVFKLENNAIYPKIVRWPLRIYRKDFFKAKRISLVAKPKPLNQMFFIISTFSALLLADLYQISSSYFAGESMLHFFSKICTLHFWTSLDVEKIGNWLLHALISFVIISIIFFGVLKAYNKFKIWSEESHWS